MRRRALVAALGFAVLIVGFAIAGFTRQTHLAGTNAIRSFAFATQVPAGAEACQAHENVPDGTAAVRVLASTQDQSGPEVAVRLQNGGATIGGGTLAGGWNGGRVTVNVGEIDGDKVDSSVCFRNAGPATLLLAGEALAAERNAAIGSTPTAGRVSIEYLRAGPETWWAFLPTLGRRLATVRAAVPGSATLYLWGLLVLLVAGGALALVTREGRE